MLCEQTYLYNKVVYNREVKRAGCCCRAGGVELLARQGKIKVENTLESRLAMMAAQVQR